MEKKSVKILIVEDEIFIKENLNIFLENEGFSITFSDTAENALKELKNNNTFDVGLIDMVLPEMNGEDFIMEAKKINPDMKYIIHTGSKDYFLPDSLRKLGIEDKDVFTKPIVDMHFLIERIKKLADSCSF